MSLGVIPKVRESFALHAAIVTSIGSNPEDALKQPVDARLPGNRIWGMHDASRSASFRIPTGKNSVMRASIGRRSDRAAWQQALKFLGCPWSHRRFLYASPGLPEQKSVQIKQQRVQQGSGSECSRIGKGILAQWRIARKAQGSAACTESQPESRSRH
jgi:hypothetical protein